MINICLSSMLYVCLQFSQITFFLLSHVLLKVYSMYCTYILYCIRKLGKSRKIFICITMYIHTQQNNLLTLLKGNAFLYIYVGLVRSSVRTSVTVSSFNVMVSLMVCYFCKFRHVRIVLSIYNLACSSFL